MILLTMNANANTNTNTDDNTDTKASSAGKDEASFPLRVHRMLQDADAKGFVDIVSWMPGFGGFRVHNTQAFEQQILPAYFSSQTKYRSFQRQLNLYDFQRVAEKGPYQGAYSHPYFVRSNESLCKKITRTRIKSQRNRSMSVHGSTHDAAPASKRGIGDSVFPLETQPLSGVGMYTGQLAGLGQAQRQAQEQRQQQQLQSSMPQPRHQNPFDAFSRMGRDMFGDGKTPDPFDDVTDPFIAPSSANDSERITRHDTARKIPGNLSGTSAPSNAKESQMKVADSPSRAPSNMYNSIDASAAALGQTDNVGLMIAPTASGSTMNAAARQPAFAQGNTWPVPQAANMASSSRTHNSTGSNQDIRSQTLPRLWEHVDSEIIDLIIETFRGPRRDANNNNNNNHDDDDNNNDIEGRTWV